VSGIIPENFVKNIELYTGTEKNDICLWGSFYRRTLCCVTLADWLAGEL